MNDSTNTPEKESSVPFWVFLLPLLMTGVLVAFSPNFRWSEQPGGHFGGDFLQEWVGAKIVASSQRKRLYDSEFVYSEQHDKQLLGFQYSNSRYYPMVYPPFYYCAVSPLSKLDYRTATYVWAAIMTIAFCVASWLLFRFFPPGQSRFVIWFIPACVFAPWLRCVAMGQKSSVLLLLFAATFLLQYHQKHFWAGASFGLVAFKPQLGLVIGLFMLLKKQYQFVSGAALTVCAMIGLSFMFEPELWIDYSKVVTGMGEYVSTSGYQLEEAHSIWGALKLNLGSFQSETAIKTIAGILSLVVMVMAYRGTSGALVTDRPEYGIQFAALVLATILTSPHLYTYDLTLLLLPLFLVIANTRFGFSNRVGQLALITGVCVYLYSGVASRIASATNVQFSVILIATWLFLLSIWHRKCDPGPVVVTP